MKTTLYKLIFLKTLLLFISTSALIRLTIDTNWILLLILFLNVSIHIMYSYIMSYKIGEHIEEFQRKVEHEKSHSYEMGLKKSITILKMCGSDSLVEDLNKSVDQDENSIFPIKCSRWSVYSQEMTQIINKSKRKL